MKKWFNYGKRLTRTLFTRMMVRSLKAHQVLIAASTSTSTSTSNGHQQAQEGSGGRLSQLSYWLGHDMNTNYIANRGWLQHALRLKELSFSSVRMGLRRNSTLTIIAPAGSASQSTLQLQAQQQQGLKSKALVLVRSLKQLADLCGHEYDVIRKKAEAFFDTVSTRFGFKTVDVIKPMFESLTQPGTSFAAATGESVDCDLISC
jgi:hypothetical protein